MSKQSRQRPSEPRFRPRTAPTPTGEKIYYRVRGYMVRTLFTCAIFLLADILLTPIVLASYQSHASGSITLLIVYIALLLITLTFIPSFLNWRKTCLVTSAAGLRYESPRYSIYTPWRNLAELTVWPTNPALPVAALRLREPATEMHLVQGAQRQQPAIELRRALRGKKRERETLIPIGYFLHDWEHGELAEDIRHYAPQLAQPR